VITELITQRDGLRLDLVEQESAAKGEWLVNMEKALTGKTVVTELPQIIEFEEKEQKKKKSVSMKESAVVDQDDEKAED